MADFKLGRLVSTPGAVASVDPVFMLAALCRHAAGDWGEVDAEDKQTNDWSVANGARILSSYTDPQGVKFWIITEADRSATTFLLPSEY